MPVVALDDVKIRRPVRFIKMDVEGAEPLVMQGAARLLREDRPIVLSELHPTQLDRASGSTGDSFLSAMRAAGYRAHLLEHGEVGAPPRPCARRRADLGRPPSDVGFCRPPRTMRYLASQRGSRPRYLASCSPSSMPSPRAR